MIDPNVVKWYAENGYTLLSQEKPPIGRKIEGARVVQDRGLGGVVLRTRRIGVDMVRMEPDIYHDLTNNKEVPYSEVEAWR